MAMLAPRWGGRSFRSSRSTPSWSSILKLAEKIGVPPHDRHARQAGAAAGPLATVRRLPPQVRADRDGDSARFEELKSHGMEDCFKLLHFHLGSQITNIRQIKGALQRSGPRLRRPGASRARPEFVDVAAASGVDYDGSQTQLRIAVNYTLQEYANDVVYHFKVGDATPSSPIPTWWPSRAAPSPRIIPCWSSTCWRPPRCRCGTSTTTRSGTATPRAVRGAGHSDLPQPFK